jgi:cysteinyl-tRNA synthetase
MAWRYLGETFDIHGGGTDLIFPHHENELAQSVCAFPGSGFARMWVHNGMLTINGEKMSKSLNNFFTVGEVLEKAPAEAIRLLLLKTHYRASLDFSESALAEARNEMDRFYRALERTPPEPGAEVPDAVLEALCDDMNTPLAVSAMHALADGAMAGDAAAASGLQAAGDLLGLLQAGATTWFERDGTDAAEITALIQAREAARERRDFAEADRLKAELTALGVTLEDRKGADTVWYRRRTAAMAPAEK